MRVPSRRSGYLDPATGSYVLQMAIAGFLAAFYALRNFWSGLFSSPEPEEEAGEEATGSGDEGDAGEDDAREKRDREP